MRLAKAGTSDACKRSRPSFSRKSGCPRLTQTDKGQEAAVAGPAVVELCKREQSQEQRPVNFSGRHPASWANHQTPPFHTGASPCCLAFNLRRPQRRDSIKDGVAAPGAAAASGEGRACGVAGARYPARPGPSQSAGPCRRTARRDSCACAAGPPIGHQRPIPCFFVNNRCQAQRPAAPRSKRLR